MAKDKNKSESNGGAKKIERPTSDDLEILKIVINQNQGLQTRVLQKIKTHLATSKMTMFDKASDKEKNKTKKPTSGSDSND